MASPLVSSATYPTGVYCPPTQRTRSPPVQNTAKMLNRLRRIEGQVRGVTRMVEADRYCIDVLTQLRAVRGALVRLEGELLRGHLGHCIESAIVSGNRPEQRRKAAELIELVQRAS